MLVGLTLLGCASPAPVTSPPSAPLSEGVETVIVRTAAAAQTQTALVLPTATSTPTSTPLPTKTATITPTPTSTIVFSFAPKIGPTEEDFFGDTGGVGGNGTGGNNNEDGKDSDFVKTPVIREWDCQIMSRYPTKGTVFDGGSTFRATWVVKNTGSKTWPKHGVDIVYRSGADLVDGKPYIDIPKTISPGETVTITITMNAPKRSSDYSTRWALKVGKTEFCLMRIAFDTK